MRATSLGKFLTSLAAMALLAGLAGTTPVMGELMVLETFSDADGSLVGDTPEIGGVWANHSGTAGQMQVVGGQAKVNHALSEDANTAFATGPIGAGDKIYAAFDLTVPTQTAAPGTVYFAHFKDAGNFFGSRVFITAPAVAGNGYRLGVSGNATLIAAETFPTDLAFGTTYRVVHSYDYDTGTAQLWVDPANELSVPTIIATDVAFSDAFQAYALRQSTSNSMQMIDNLCVADAFGQALRCVPEPASMAMMLLAGLAAFGFHRRGR